MHCVWRLKCCRIVIIVKKTVADKAEICYNLADTCEMATVNIDILHRGYCTYGLNFNQIYNTKKGIVMKKILKHVTGVTLAVLFMVIAFHTNVFAADYSGTTFETAIPLAIGGEAYGELTVDCETRYFTFTTSPNKSWYRITGINSTCNSSIEMRLYNADRTHMDSAYVSSHDTNSFYWHLTPNTKYYVRVANGSWRENIGIFKLTLQETPDDYKDNYTESTSIAINREISGHIDASNDKDYFSFTTGSEKNCYYYINLINIDSDAVRVRLYDSDLLYKNSSYAYDNSQATIVEKLDPNRTYYLELSENPGKYKLKVTKAVDEAEDNYTQAKKIALNSKYNCKIQAYGDVDYYKFKTNGKDKDYTFQVYNKTSTNTLYFELFDSNNQKQGYTRYIYSGDGLKEKYTLKKNRTYYIKISGGNTCDYSLKVSCKSTTNYKITYKLNGGTNHNSNPSTYTGKKAINLKKPTRKGYDFKGWYTDKACKKSIKKISKGSAENYTLYAKWSKISLKRGTIKSLKNAGKGKANLSANKVSGADGYEVLVATNKSMTANTEKYTMKSTTKTLKLKKGTTYYVKVRAYAVDSTGNKVYGKYSKATKIKL